MLYMTRVLLVTGTIVAGGVGAASGGNSVHDVLGNSARGAPGGSIAMNANSVHDAGDPGFRALSGSEMLHVATETEKPPKTVEGRIYCTETGRPLSGVHIYVEGAGVKNLDTGTVSDRDGQYELDIPDVAVMKLDIASSERDRASTDKNDTDREVASTNRESSGIYLRVSRLGYREKQIRLKRGEPGNLAIYLQPETLHLDEVVIESVRDAGNGDHRNHSRHAATTEEFIGELQGVNMIKRANYAWEPSIRGMSAGRISVLIDDVEMVPACVDRMDPVTSYVQTENLERVTVNRGNTDLQTGNRPGGSLNMITSRPGYNRGFFGKARFEGQHNAMQRQYHLTSGYSNDRTAVQSAFTWRSAGDYHTGGGEKVTDSGYRKMNLKLDADHRFSADHTGKLTYIGDLATDIGYPALIMDTEEARSHFLRYEHEWRRPLPGISSLTFKPYHTRVDHWMDDYGRDVSDREVMPDMYMPMYGNTRTTGMHLDGLMYHDEHMLELGLKLNRLDAFADMRMEPLDPDESDMYLLNIGNVRFSTAYISASYSWLPGGRWSVSGSMSLELSDRNLSDESSRKIFRAEDPEVPLSGMGSVWSGSMEVTVRPAERWTLLLHLSDSGRLPSHIEQYGYYIYNPVDDFFYHGNPGLSPERSTQLALNLLAEAPDRTAGAEAGLFFNHMRNYIDGKPVSDMFRRYTNHRSALMTGGELTFFWEPAAGWRTEAGTAYVYAENRELDEPLPMMPPLEGYVNLSRIHERITLDLRLRAVAGQNRVADRTTRERPSNEYFLVDVSGRYDFEYNISLHFGIRNLFDERYREHTTPGQMPGPGRDLSVRLQYSW